MRIWAVVKCSYVLSLINTFTYNVNIIKIQCTLFISLFVSVFFFRYLKHVPLIFFSNIWHLHQYILELCLWDVFGFFYLLFNKNTFYASDIPFHSMLLCIYPSFFRVFFISKCLKGNNCVFRHLYFSLYVHVPL